MSAIGRDSSLKRSSERLIDLVVLSELLLFGWLMRESQPALAGVITAAAVQFWLSKNASAPHASVEEAAAIAAAEVLKVAEASRKRAEEATPVTVVDQPVTVEIK